MRPHHSYQLYFTLSKAITLQVGKLGTFHFPAGEYCYTGSAKRNMEARLARHQRKDKPLRWHIDYLTSLESVQIHHIHTSNQAECPLNQSLKGEIIAPGFGASDCQQGCASHLLYFGTKKRAGEPAHRTEGEKILETDF